MKKFMVGLAAFVMAAGISVVVNASDAPAWQQSLEPENYVGHVDPGEISGPIETGAMPAKAESSKVRDLDTDALMRSVEPENYAGHPVRN
jgi:hypothetical protein